MKIYVVNGSPESGKTTFEHFVQAELGEDFCLILSTVDIVKECARTYFGWDGVKDSESRKMLSDLKDLMTRFNDIPYKDIEKKIVNYKAHMEEMIWDTSKLVVFIDCREPSEIQKFVDRLGAKTIFVERKKAESQATSNHADAHVRDFEYDYIIDNNMTLLNLAYLAHNFVEQL